MNDWNINPVQNYERLSVPGHINTGMQIINLLELANPMQQAAILLDIWPTDLPATDPKDRYGIPKMVKK